MKKPISIMVIIHNDLQDYSRERLNEEYFAWLKPELEEISGRPVFIQMSDNQDVPELTDYNYRNDDTTASVAGWKERVTNLHSVLSKQENFDRNLIKILLLTRYNISEVLWGLGGAVGGIAYSKSYAGISAITSRRAPAHEIGHMLGATHEDSEVVYDGWWHDSIMLSDAGSQYRGNNYRFSDKNRQNIRNYLKKFP
ncbi:reprolysin-like metallopeptidase [Pseudomonas sp. MHK4]|jgi:hypothetical protein